MKSNNIKVSIIIPLYKDLKSLKIVLTALERQTHRDFEIIIAEDDDSADTIKFLQNYTYLNIIHISQPDTGRNKVIIQNKAILKANGEYLFFIDGDIVPFKYFIEYSLKIAKPRRVLSGRRVNLDEKITTLIKDEDLDIQDIENNYIKFLWSNRNNRNARSEQGIQLNPDNFIYKKIISKRNRNTEILGCNFSCFKNDIIAINGFNEGYGDSIIGQEDTELTWRFEGLNYEIYSAKNIANCFHLWHKENTLRNHIQDEIDLELMSINKKNNKFICEKGLNTHYSYLSIFI